MVNFQQLDFSRADGESDVWNVSLTHISSEEDGGKNKMVITILNRTN